MLNSEPAHELAIVVPVYNEEKIVATTVARIAQSLESTGIDFIVVCVDDGSTDETWAKLEELATSDRRVHGVRLSRNFGHDAAVFCGLRLTNSRLVITMDCDGQHPFSALPEMIRVWRESGCDVVNGVKRHRGDEKLFYRVAARIFGRALSRTMNTDLRNATEFKLLTRKAVAALLQCEDYHLFYRALVPWIGLRQRSFEFDVAESLRPGTHWNVMSLARFAMSGLVMFTDAPIRFIILLGVIALVVCALIFAKLLFGYFHGEVPTGYSTLLTLQLMNLGFIMTAIGIIGLYVRTTLQQAMTRPRAIVDTVCPRGNDDAADAPRYL